MPHRNQPAAAETAGASRPTPIAEMRATFPDLDFIHEIEVRGGCDWRTLMSIGDVLSRLGGRLESLAARRYGNRGELVTCRVRSMDDTCLHDALDHIRALPGVGHVGVTHILTA